MQRASRGPLTGAPGLCTPPRPQMRTVPACPGRKAGQKNAKPGPCNPRPTEMGCQQLANFWKCNGPAGACPPVLPGRAPHLGRRCALCRLAPGARLVKQMQNLVHATLGLQRWDARNLHIFGYATGRQGPLTGAPGLCTPPPPQMRTVPACPGRQAGQKNAKPGPCNPMPTEMGCQQLAHIWICNGPAGARSPVLPGYAPHLGRRCALSRLAPGARLVRKMQNLVMQP